MDMYSIVRAIYAEVKTEKIKFREQQEQHRRPLLLLLRKIYHSAKLPSVIIAIDYFSHYIRCFCDKKKLFCAQTQFLVPDILLIIKKEKKWTVMIMKKNN